MEQTAPKLPTDLTALFDDLAVPIIVYQLDGLVVVFNRAAAVFWNDDPAKYVGVYNAFADPTQADRARAAFERVKRGETFVREPNMDARAPGLAHEEQIWIQATIFPIRDDRGEIAFVGYLYENVTRQVEQRAQLERGEQELREQQRLIQDLSSPVVQLWDGIVLAPLVGTIDARRATIITEELLVAVGRYTADIVILDITGVAMVDTAVANYLITAARAIGLLGAQVVLVGIRSEVAQTMAQLQIDLSQVVTLADLKAGVSWAFARLGVNLKASKV